MKYWPIRLLLTVVCVLAFPTPSPAPFIYRPGEGLTYEPVGSEGKWRRRYAKEQLDLAQQAFDSKSYGLAVKAARRVVKEWPLSDYAPKAQYLLGRAYEAKGYEEKAFKEYQKVLDKYPKIDNFPEILQRQYEIANLFLAGKRFKLWGILPLFSSMDKTAEMYEKIVRSGPYSDVAAQAQLKIGAAREKQKDYPVAAKAYETAADRYNDRPAIASEAMYRQGLAYLKQSKRAEYDQSTASQAIAIFTDFTALYPNDPRSNEAISTIAELRREQARGSFQTAKFYEKRKKWRGALVYYNEVISLDPDSPYTPEARERIDLLLRRVQGTPQ